MLWQTWMAILVSSGLGRHFSTFSSCLLDSCLSLSLMALYRPSVDSISFSPLLWILASCCCKSWVCCARFCRLSSAAFAAFAAFVSSPFTSLSMSLILAVVATSSSIKMSCWINSSNVLGGVLSKSSCHSTCSYSLPDKLASMANTSRDCLPNRDNKVWP